MKVIGIDFTSSPSNSKPITSATGFLEKNTLSITALDKLVSFEQFEALLSEPGEWIAGIDFPFGQSQKLITNLQWPINWEAYVSLVSQLDKVGFVRLLDDYKADRAVGDKEHRREIDVLAKSISPQKLYGVPVGKMFFEGAKRILASNTDIVPVRRKNSSQVVVEAYPAIVARRFIDKTSYKNDQKSKQTDALRTARLEIVKGIQSERLMSVYGFHLALTKDHEETLVDDASGDALDSVLCAIQSAWAHSNKANNYGVPSNINTNEGWITDPMFNCDIDVLVVPEVIHKIEDSAPCPFCTLPLDRIETQNRDFIVIRDGYPISPGHTLIIPKRHISSFFDLSRTEQNSLFYLLETAKDSLDKEFQPDSYNIGINDGAEAGQTVPHLHIHLIPRYKGDQNDPRGGVRWLIPDKAKYWND